MTDDLSIDESLRRRFERAWGTGCPLEIEECVPPPEDPRYLPTLEELVHVAMELQWRGSQRHAGAGAAEGVADPASLGASPLWLEHYLQRFSQLRRPGVLLRLVRHEFRLRCRHGERPNVDEYHRRFPGVIGEAADLADAESRAISAGDTTKVPPMTYRESSHGMPISGQRIGKFELREEAGRGSFGAVFRAWDTDLRRVVALKIPRAGQALTAEAEQRFLREGRAAASLQHPGIVPVYEVGRCDNVPYIVTEFVEGMTLKQLMQRPERLGFAVAAKVVAQAAEALEAAHRQGVVHRDVKPANLMIVNAESETGGGAGGELRVRVTDFGLAQREDGESTLTRDGELLGTPAYMSPEQASGKGRRVDGRADVFSLGAVMYQLLTGELPFRGSARMMLKQILEDEPPPPRQLNEHIPRDLETVTIKCLAKEPARRYASAGELAADLRRWLCGEPVRARRVGRTERLWRWCARNPLVASLASLSTLLLLVVAVVASAAYFHELNRRREEERLRQDLLRAMGGKEQALQKAEAELYLQLISRADRQWVTRHLGQTVAALDRCPPQHRQWEWHYLRRVCGLELFMLQQPAAAVGIVAISPDGQWFVTPGGKDTLTVFDALTFRELRAIAAPGVGGSLGLAISPDGQRIAVTGSFSSSPETPGHGTRVYDAVSGELKGELPAHPTGTTAVRFSMDGAQLATAGRDHCINVWDAHTWQLQHALDGHTQPVLGLAFGPQGLLVSASLDGTLKTWDAGAGKERHTLRGHDGPVQSVAVTPNGQRILSGGRDGTIRLWEADTGRSLTGIATNAGPIATLDISRDGVLFAAGSSEGTVSIRDTGSGREVRTLKEQGGVLSLAFSPDGTRLVSKGLDQQLIVWNLTVPEVVHLAGSPSPTFRVAQNTRGCLAAAGYDGTIQLWPPGTGQAPFTLRGGNDSSSGKSAAFALAFSSDDRWLAAGTVDGTVTLWRAEDRTQLFEQQGDGKKVLAVGFSSDGGRLFSIDSGGRLRSWDTASGRENRISEVRDAAGGLCAAFARDARLVAVATAMGDSFVIDTATGDTVHVFSVTPGNPAAGIAFDARTERLAALTASGELAIWDLPTGSPVCRFQAHRALQSAPVAGLAFSPNGQRLATFGADGRIRLWETGTGQEVFSLPLDAHGAFAVDFSPDGRRLAAGSYDGVRLWDAGDDMPSQLVR